VSHHLHRRLQPEVRMKNDGTPTSIPFPWRLVKVSWMLEKSLSFAAAEPDTDADAG